MGEIAMDPQTFTRQLGLHIAERRKSIGLSQAQLAERAGVSKRLLVNIETGKAPQVSLGRLLSVLSELDLGLTLVRPGEPPITAEYRQIKEPYSSTEAETAALHFERYRHRLTEMVSALASSQGTEGNHGN